MKISVVIPTHNSSATIQATLDSVIRQTVSPDEILILDDGSTDNTISILDACKQGIKVIHQKNLGVANARNTLCKLAQGELIAFLDHDDIWHPKYLEVQSSLFGNYPNAVAFFTGHVNFYGYSNYQWSQPLMHEQFDVEFLEPLKFFKRYNQATGPFASMSYCCVPKSVIMLMGKEPFCVSGVDDSYLCNVLSLLGPVVYDPLPLVAYRITKEAQSTNKLRDYGLWVEVFQLLETRFRNLKEAKLSRAFRMAFASKRRQYAKRLMGAGKALEARRQLVLSLRNAGNPLSRAKSLLMLLLTYMPHPMQPRWPSSQRESK